MFVIEQELKTFEIIQVKTVKVYITQEEELHQNKHFYTCLENDQCSLIQRFMSRSDSDSTVGVKYQLINE